MVANYEVVTKKLLLQIKGFSRIESVRVFQVGLSFLM